MEKRKLKSKKTDMLKNIAKHSMECGVSSEEEKEGCGGKDIQKKGFKPRLKE